MSIILSIKKFIASRALKQEMQSYNKLRKACKFSFDAVKTVGILFDATNAEDYEIVKRYVLYLREHRKRTKVIVFFNTKVLPPMTYSKLEYDFFSTKEINWMGKPSTTVIKNFIDEEFDLLIDLNVHDHFPLKYIAALSKANFKVGKYNEKDTEMYDMMIDADNTKTVKYFLRQVDIYITMMNKVEPTLN